ncbi:unnamed protein product [Prunus armeniaca]
MAILPDEHQACTWESTDLALAVKPFRFSLVSAASSFVTTLISIFKQWDMQALPISGGEQCIGFAINGSEFEKPENNPAITCSFPVDRVHALLCLRIFAKLMHFCAFAFCIVMCRDLSYNYFSGSFPRWVTTISQLLPGLNCLPRNFPCHRSTPRYANFSIKCGGPQMRGNDGILYKAEDSALGPATFNVTSTQKWAVSNAGFSDNLNQSFVETTLTQVSGADLTPELYKTQECPQGYLRRKDFDISKQAGGVNRAVPRPFKVNVTENYLDIHLFWAGKGICCIPEQDLTPTTPGKKSRTGLIVVLYMRRKTSEKDDDEDLLGLGPRPNTFSSAELSALTEDFNPSNKLGEGRIWTCL